MVTGDMLEQPRIRAIAWVTALASALVAVGAGPSARGGTTVARILYVDRSNPACSDSGTGTVRRPYCSISAAAEDATAGQAVQVAAGVYAGGVTVGASGTSRRPIVIRAAPKATVVITAPENGFTITGRHWVTVKGFTVTHTGGYGIAVSSSSFVKIVGNHVSYAGLPAATLTRSGIWLSATSYSLVAHNTTDHDTYAGIYLTNGSTRNEVRANTTFANASVYERRAPGIRVYEAPGNTIDRNISHDNEDSGIECFKEADDTLVSENVTYDNGDHGIDNHGCTGNRVLGNTIYRNVAAGINVEGGSTDTTIADNITVDNGITSPRTRSDIRVDADSTDGTSMDSDLVYLTTPTTLFIWSSGIYQSLAALRDATGQEPHGIDADPRWADSAHGNFHLTAGSPAIDSANSGYRGWPATDIQGHPRRDDPATANTGLGPRHYDDRGSYEYQPPRR
jgi:parallel beta-helix repeat protein